MHDAVPVRLRQPLGDGHRDTELLFEPFVPPRQPLSQRSTGDELLHDVRVATLLADVIDGDDIRM